MSHRDIEDLPGWAGAMIFAVALVFITGIWMLTGYYKIDPGEEGIELVFSKVESTATPGLNWNWPWPVGDTLQEQVQELRQLTIGVDSKGRDTDGVILTGDENLVDIVFEVQWKVQNVEKFRFNIENPELSIRDVADSAMREIVGRNNIDDVLTDKKEQIQFEVSERMQRVLADEYDSGIFISSVELKKVEVPAEVRDAYRDVQDAKTDAESYRNQANAYRNDVVPAAEAYYEQVVNAAQGYASAVVAEANGRAKQFTDILVQYRAAPEITRQRISYETLEIVSRNADIRVIEPGTNVLTTQPINRSGNVGK